MNNICFFIYNYLSSIIKNVFYRNKGEEEHNITQNNTKSSEKA